MERQSQRLSGSDAWLDLGLAVAGAAAVSIALWLLRSVVASVIGLPLGANELIIVVGALAAARVLSHGGQAIRGAAFLMGMAVAWAIQAAEMVSICTSALLYRPCTGSEIAGAVVPATALLVVSLLMLVRSRAHAGEDDAI
jgi:hypothetical protein